MFRHDSSGVRVKMLDCITRIKTSYSGFSEKERQIADYILTAPENIVHSTINQVAEDLGVADATVFRFCKRIGFKGYQAMKIALATEVVSPIEDIHETITESDNEKAVAEKIFQSNIRTLESTQKIIESMNFEDAVKALLQARRIEFYGSGGSGIIASDAHHKFIRTGIPSVAYTDSHLQLMSASQLTEEDVVVFISHSGTNKDILEVFNVVKETGAKAVAITNYAKSPLSQKADIVLYSVSTETDYRSEALSSRIAQLSIIDSLYVNIMLAKKDEAKESLQKTRNALSIKRL